jgi:hypothetical protein
MELSPKLQSLSKVLQKLSEEVQRLEAEKVHYGNLEKNITRLDSNQKIIFGLIFSFYCVFMTMKFWSWVKKRNKSGHDQQRPTFVASPAAQCFEERSPLSELRRTKCQNLAPVVFSLQHP